MTAPLQPETPAPRWLVHCDGSAVPNPGRMGLGATLTAPDGTQHALSLAPEGRGCNNEAELRAMLVALQFLKDKGASALRIHCDNSIVVAQATDAAAEPVARLAPLFDELRALLASFAEAEVVWLPRHRNREADALARAAVGLAPKRVAPRGKRRRG